MLAWRDHLREHPDAAAAYEAAKREIAARFPNDPGAYANGKTAFFVDAFRDMGRELPHSRTYGVVTSTCAPRGTPGAGHRARRAEP